MSDTSQRAPISRLATAIQHYAWGSHEAIASLQGRPRARRPEAELWIGAHPQAPSHVMAVPGAPPLGDWLASAPQRLLGAACVERFGERLPYLVKILAAAEPLSIQLHPDAGQAAEGFAREDAEGIARDHPARSYRDPLAKIEMLVAWTEFHGLCGLRPDDELARGVADSGSPGLERLHERASAEAEPGRRAAHVFEALARLTADAGAALAAELREGLAGAPPSPARHWVEELLARHPRDPMAAAPRLLHCVRLAPGQALHVTPGVPHAYLAGTGLEVMTASDNVVRGGLTAKHVDRPALAELLDRRSPPPPVREPERVSERETRYAGPTPAFEVRRVDGSGDAPGRLRGGLPTVVLCQSGRVELRSGGADDVPLELTATEAAFVPAARADVELRGRAVVWTVAPTP